ncbi:MAG: zinc ribbon domain-containing protein [Verrucomicrobia bacterium]|nr:zinc ribbon domain-containing protein [Verrucomicrobiota bacterium]
MPIYEFNCKACGKDAELLVPSTTWKGAKCPSCGSARLTKKLSVFAVAGGDAGASAGMPSCSGNPSACGRCGTN